MNNSRPRLALLGSLAATVLFMGCDSAPTSPNGEQAKPFEPSAGAEQAGISLAAHAGTNQQLAAVRGATAPFHNFGKAAAAGWDTPVTGCDEQLPDGAQGIHYANVALIDGAVSLLEPEILQYEPEASGRLRLVGVEYIVPLDFDEPDPLFGHHFHANEAAGVWALHVWIWRHNPSGMFADWNPKVSCEHAG